MIQINDSRNCCGCTACASVCNHDAITMKPDALGFLYPEVDNGKCVDCGLCETVCAFNDHYDTSLNLDKPLVYCARHKDMNEVETSRSGAAFIAISDYILEQGGVVYGAGYTDHFRVVHKRATTKEGRNEFKGSKYVQSDINSVFRQVKKDLRAGLMVLFSGTPCQTAGLNSFIGKKLRENLFLIDIICHGVPSPYVWRDYINYIEAKEGSSICDLNFRNKQRFGYKCHKETFKFNGQNKAKYYLFEYYSNIIFRRSCEICYYANTKRPSDITLGDYWGHDKQVLKQFGDEKGCSLLFLNTQKGQALFSKIRDTLIVKTTSLKLSLQPNLCHPSPKNLFREVFEQKYQEYGFEYVATKYGNLGKNHLIKNLKLLLKYSIKELLARFRRLS